ncbi:MAG: amino acid permease [Burkholderiaceae bacterium]|nr:amino acid permease [Burkholderiaceae bacterium]
MQIPSSDQPKPALSTFDAVMIIVGIVIGGGIFALPPAIAGLTGSLDWMLIAWGVGALLTLVGALCYAEMAAAFPHAGGDYHFLTRAFGRDVSFFFGWARVTVILTGSIAMLGFVCGDYLTRVLDLGPYSSAIYAALIIIALTAVNLAGLKESARAQNVLTAVEVTGLLLVVVAGLMVTGPAQPAATAAAPAASSGLPAMFGLALVFVLFTFGGWNEAAYISAEVKGGQRAILKVLVISIVILTAIYLVFVLALVKGLGFDGLKASKAVGADIMRAAFGPVGEKIIGAMVAVAALTSINATMIVGARNNFALGQDWPLLSFMSRWHGQRNAPVIALLVQSAIALLLVAVAAVEKGGVKTMVEFTAPVFWGFLVLVGVGFFVLRFKYAHVPRPFKVPLYPILPLAFIATCGYLFYSSVTYAQSQNAVQVSFYVMGLGLIAWVVARLKRG